MSVHTMQFEPALGEAILECDRRLLQVHQTLHHMKSAVEPLAWLDMTTCAKLASQIRADLHLQYRMGDVVARMRKKLEVQYPAVFGSAPSTELFRQFLKVAVVFYEMDDDEESSDYGQKILADHEAFIVAAQAAIEKES